MNQIIIGQSRTVKFLATFIIMTIIAIIIAIVAGIVITFISGLFIGISISQIHIAAFLSFLFVKPYLYIFQAQTEGLLYSEIE